jgi:hypothetical protein
MEEIPASWTLDFTYVANVTAMTGQTMKTVIVMYVWLNQHFHEYNGLMDQSIPGFRAFLEKSELERVHRTTYLGADQCDAK